MNFWDQATSVEASVSAVGEAVKKASAPVAPPRPRPTTQPPPVRRPPIEGRKWTGDVELVTPGETKKVVVKTDYLPSPTEEKKKEARYASSLVEDQEVARRFKGRATFNKIREDEDSVVPWTKDGVSFAIQDHRPQPNPRYEIVDPTVRRRSSSSSSSNRDGVGVWLVIDISLSLSHPLVFPNPSSDP